MATPLNSTVLKAFSILDLFTEDHAEITTQDVVEATGLNHVTAHRFLKTLTHIGALTTPYKGVYRLGLKMVDYGRRADDTRRLAILLQPYLNILADETGEGAMATTFDGSNAICIASALSHRFSMFNARVGARHEAYATANGKLWLAQLSPRELDDYLALNDLVPFSERTYISRERLLSEITQIKATGYAANRGEREKGLGAVAIPLFGPHNTMVVGVSIYGPEERIAKAGEKNMVAILQRVLKGAQTALQSGYRF